MNAAQSDLTGRIGVSETRTIVNRELQWAFREQFESDWGIDAQIEPREESGLASAQLIALQIKGGPSWFQFIKSKNCWRFRSDLDHLAYWLRHVLPVIVVLVDTDTGEAFWQLVIEQNVRRTKKAFTIDIPVDQRLDASARGALRSIARGDDARAQENFEHNLRLLPLGADEALRTAYETAPLAAARVADLLAEGRTQPDFTAEALVAAEPSFVVDSPACGLLWLAIAEYAQAHSANRQSAEAFELAADHGAPQGARVRAFAGIMLGLVGETERARSQLERARDDGARLVASVGLAMLEVPLDNARPIPIPDVLRAAPPTEVDGDTFLLVFLAEQRERNQDIPGAIELFERAITRSPRSPGPKLGLAQVLFREFGLHGARSGFQVRRARQLAEEARLELQRWDGPSEVPLRMSVHLDLGQGETTKALVESSPSPVGTATPREAADPEIAATGALAALHLQRTEDLERFLEVLAGSPRRLIIEGWRAIFAGDRALARRRWLAALRAVDDDLMKVQCLSQLARFGIWPRGAARDLRERGVIDDLAFQIFESTAMVRSKFDVAVNRLRALSEQSHLAGAALVQAYEENGKRGQALDECRVQMARWPETQFQVLLADLLRGEGRDDEACELLEALIGRGDISPDLRHSFRRWLIHYYGGRTLWGDVVQIARDALAERPDDPDIGWNYLIALSNLRQIPDARTVLRQMNLVPDGFDEMRLWIQLHLGEPWTDGEVMVAVEAAGRARDDQLLAITLVSLASRELAIEERTYDAATVAAVRSAEEVIGVDPTIVRSFAKRDDLDEVVMERFKQDAEMAARLTADVRDGSLPLGRLAGHLHISYAQALVQRAAGVLVASSEELLASEMQVATEHFNRPWVVDTSALYVSSLLGEAGARIRAAASQRLAVEAAADDVLRGRDAVRIETSSTLAMRYEASTASFRQVTVGPEEADLLRRRVTQLEQLIQGCALRRSTASLPKVLSYDDAWAAPLDLAKAEGAPLYSDDVALRAIARSQGIPSFGTFALLRSALGAGLFEPEANQQYDASLRALFMGFVVDVPVTVGELAENAEATNWGVGSPAAEVITRAAWWNAHGVDDWQQIADRVPANDLTRWTQWAIAGRTAASRVDEWSTKSLEIISSSLAGAYLKGVRDFEFSIRELVMGSFLHDVANVQTQLLEAIGRRLTGRDPDPLTAAAAIVGGAHLLDRPSPGSPESPEQ